MHNIYMRCHRGDEPRRYQIAALWSMFRPERYAARTQSTRLFLRPFDAHSAHKWVEEQLTPLHEVLTPFYLAISGWHSEPALSPCFPLKLPRINFAKCRT